MFQQYISTLKFSILSLALLICAGAGAQSVQVLSGNGKFSPAAAPQGAVRAQRQFYLIDSVEAARAGLKNATVLKSIGFTTATAQNIATKGKFRVYLQNTTDMVSRVDTGWTSVVVNGNKLSLNSLTTGNYEWQVRSNCTITSPFSPSNQFEVNRDACKAPTRLVTDNITGTAATLQWTKPATMVDSFKVEYTRIDSVSWTTVYTKNAFYEATGLIPGQSYQWKVASSCSDADPRETAIFTTIPSGTCSTATGLSVASVNDTSATVSWNIIQGSIQYELRYKRVGSSTWDYESAIDTTATLLRLVSGTSYEWQVRGVCSATEKGAFADGATFITNGIQRCYFPENLYIDSLAGTAAKLSWDTAANAVSYEVRYRQLETISWANAISGMTEVHKDSITIRDTIGVNYVPFKGGSPFTYDGKGLYVAFEYMNDSAALSSRNLSLVNYSDRSFKNEAGEDSARMIVSLGASSADSLPVKLMALTVRPETWFGSNTLSDSAAVLAVYAMGQHAVPYGSPARISALIRNYAGSDQTYNVTLKVKNALNQEKHSQVVSATVKKDSILLVTFSDWSPTENGLDSIIVSIPAQPGENVVNNNSGFYLQEVNNSMLAYADNSDAISFTGTDTTSGLTLARYKMSSCGSVNAVQVYLGPTAVGHPVYGVITNAAGTILDTSAVVLPTSSQVNRYHTFYFSSPVAIPSGSDFYVGLAQPKIPGGLAPVGVQWESGYTRKGAYYKAGLNGMGLKDTLNAGRLMIRAEIVPGTLSPTITGNLVLCPGGSNTLSAASITRRFANAVVAASSQGTNDQFTATQALGAPDVYPGYGFNSNAWMGTSAQREYLVLKFPGADSINYIDIYQTLNPGAIDTVYVKNPSTGLFESVYTGAITAADTTSQIKRVNFSLTAFKVDEIRIALDGAASSGNNAIDAVSIGRLTAATFATYNWTRKTASGTSSAGTASTVNASAAGDYTLSVTNSEGCTASYTATVSTPDQAPPVIAANGPLAFCMGDSVTLYSNKKTGNTWSTGATTEAIVVKAGGSYSLTYNDGTGCGSRSSNTVSVLVNEFPVVKISGVLGICPGASTTLTAAATGTASYTYQWSNGTATPATVVAGAGSQSVTVTDNVGCATTQTAITFVTPKPEPKLEGKFNFCPGGSTTLNAGAGFATYAWSTGATATSNISVDAIGKYHVTVTDSFGCTGADTALVGQFVPPTPNITGNRSICGSPTTLNAGGGYVSYTWSNGETTQTVLINKPGIATVTVTDFNGCTGSASAATIKDSLPPRPGPITSNSTSTCNAPGNTYTISAIPEATHYVWFVPEGATIVSGQGSTTLKVAFTPGFVAGQLMVAASNACGQSGSLVPRLFPIKLKPATPVGITGQVSGVCSGPKIYRIPAVDGATSYTWRVPPGVSITAGQGTTVITVAFLRTFVSGSICVKAVNACGSSLEKCMAVTGIPDKPGAITGPDAVCFKQTNVRYSITPVTGAKTYTWTVPLQAVILSGQGTTDILVRFASVHGNVTVKANNDCGSSAIVSRSVAVTNCAVTGVNPTTGSINSLAQSQHVGLDVIASAGSVSKTNKMQLDWTLGEPCIETMSSSGRLYTQGFHQPIVVVAKEAIVNATKLKITAAPNPVSTKLKVSFEAASEQTVMLSVLDAGGRIVFKKTVLTSDNGIEINMAGFSQGLYILHVHTPKGVLLENFKIVKMN